MGIRVTPGGEYRVYFQMTGEDGGELIGTVELIFTSDSARQPKRWVASEALTAAVADLQGANLAGAAATIQP